MTTFYLYSRLPDTLVMRLSFEIISTAKSNPVVLSVTLLLIPLLCCTMVTLHQESQYFLFSCLIDRAASISYLGAME